MQVGLRASSMSERTVLVPTKCPSLAYGLPESQKPVLSVTMKISLLSMTTIVLILLVTGCTTQNVYDSFRFNRELECQQMQGIDRDDCMRRTGMSYDEYQRQLKQQNK